MLMGWNRDALAAFGNPMRVQEIGDLYLPLESTLILSVCSLCLLCMRGGNITISVSRDEISWLTVVALGGTKADIVNGMCSCNFSFFFFFWWVILKSI